MPSPADPACDTVAQAQPGQGALARGILVVTPGAIATVIGALAWMMSVDLNPADRAYPRVLATLLILTGLFNVIADLRGRAENDGTDGEYGRLVAWRVVGFAALIAVTVWLVKPIGFYPAAGLLILGGLWIMGVRKPLVLIGYPLLLIGVGYLLFSVLIGVPLPLARGF
ncbi:tripartite tricarboxylate transporter TctB family protein [Mycobacterium sp. NPDC003449]